MVTLKLFYLNLIMLVESKFISKSVDKFVYISNIGNNSVSNDRDFVYFSLIANIIS